MDQPANSKLDEELARQTRRAALRQLNAEPSKDAQQAKNLDSSLKRHTALIKRLKLSLGADNRDALFRDIEQLTLEKYVDELAGATIEGLSKCKTEKDVWAATEVISALHRRFPTSYTPTVVNALGQVLAPPNKAALAAMTPEQREKEDGARLARQRPVLRVSAELALVGVIRDAEGRAGGEWIMKVIKDLLSNDPSLSSLPLLATFLKSYARPFLGLTSPTGSKQISEGAEPGTVSDATAANGTSTASPPIREEDELIEKEVREKFKRTCEVYYENVSKKLVIEHKRLQEQDRRNHEAYIRSGEIFEDRQQAYEKMAKGHEKLLSGCQTLSDLLFLPMPELPVVSSKSDSIQIGTGGIGLGNDGDDATFYVGGKWEDEEERRYFEDIQDLKDFVPKSVLGIEEGADAEEEKEEEKEKELRKKEAAEEEVRKLEEELKGLSVSEGVASSPKSNDSAMELLDDEEENAPTPTPGTPKDGSPPGTPQLAAQGPTQLLTALLARLPDCTNRALIDQAAVDFAFLNSKASRKRLVRFLGQVPKNRTDLLPHYSRLVATLNPYMPDVGTDLVAILDEEFRYLQRKKNVVKELSEVRLKNLTFLSNLTKFRVVPSHVILHMFKVCLDDFSGTNIDNIALLLEGCGRFLLRTDDTRERFSKMVELMRRKQSMQHLDQRQLLLLENAYYQCNPPERGPKIEKVRPPMELFIRHLIYDVLAKKTVDKVLKLIRKLQWDDPSVVRVLHKVFTKPWKIKYSNLSLLAMLTYDLQRYYPSFTIGVVDQILEDVRRGLETNVYKNNQRRVASMKLLGELYIYRLFGSGIIFDTFWSLVTFGHPEGHPVPLQPCTIDMPDDFFRIRLVCVLLDTCGMCFDKGSQKKKLDNFLIFFQYYVLCKLELPMDIDFMLSDSIEAVRPKLTLVKNVQEAAVAVDEMFATAFKSAGLTVEDEDSGDDSDEESERARGDAEEEEEVVQDDDDDNRSESPEPVVHLITQENIGPSEEEDSEFAKELAKMITDSSAESRKVDRRTAMAMWDSAVLPAGARKKRPELDPTANDEESDAGVMNFTLITKRGNKQQTRALAVPSESALAVHTRTAQQQEQEEQKQLKRLVLDYEQREEAEEMKALENKNKYGAIKIRYAG